jgi:aerobic C4-dicarboxylate transport protein
VARKRSTLSEGLYEVGPDQALRVKQPLYKSLFVQIIVAIVAGIVVGIVFPQAASVLQNFGTGFIDLIEMVIAPLIFLVIVTGIAHMGDVKSVGRIAVKALIYFLCCSTFALLFGLVLGNLVHPGAGLHIDPSHLSKSAVTNATGDAEPPGAAAFILGIIPTSFVNALATNNILQVLVFSIFVGSAVIVLGREKVAPLMNVLDAGLAIVFKIMSWVMKLAPLGAFGAMAYVVGLYGVASLATYLKLILTCYAAAVLFIALLFLVAWVFARVPLWSFIKYTRQEFGLALGTASTESVLPRMITKLSDAGASRGVAGIVIPTGYSFNLDGAAIYLSISLLFLCQAFDVKVGLGEQLAAVGVLLLTSKGMAGVPGSSFLALSATATALGLFPVAGVALLLGADRLMDAMRVSVNLLGNCVATFVVARWEGLLDYDQMRAAFASDVASSEPEAIAEEAVGLETA